MLKIFSAWLIGFLLGAWTVGGFWFYLYLVKWEEGDQEFPSRHPILAFAVARARAAVKSGSGWRMVVFMVLMGPWGWAALLWACAEIIGKALKKVRRSKAAGSPAPASK